MAGSDDFSMTGDWTPDGSDDSKSNADGPERHDPMPERIGRYVLRELVGRGGFGSVYRAWDEELERVVAIKVPRHKPGQEKNHRLKAAYLKEAQHVASLEHQNIVPVYDIVSYEETGDYCIVSRLIEGADLHARMRESQMSYDQVAVLIASIADGLDFAHETGLVHRDIKPSNILLDKNDRPYVTDFGLAVRYETTEIRSEIVGTPSYMSPEQALGEGHRIDGRTDIFSLGIVLYEMLAGRLPFKADSTMELFNQITVSEPTPLRQIDATIPRELERICMHCLERRSVDRYETAAQMSSELRDFARNRSRDGRADTTDFSVGPLAPPESRRQTPSQSEIRVVPKGLRSFDAHDCDFYIRLLPGARDRDGLPQSIRFWKSWIEDNSGDTLKTVGMIYGPSGCGKSSLMKAGILPLLPKNVIPVYVEARSIGTEERLYRELQRRFPALEDAGSLAELLSALRRGYSLEDGTSVVLIVDQFEQWLHAQEDMPTAELTLALRQCDGQRLKTILMVRDDFWLSISRLMRELEVPLVEGENSAMVDLFDELHARKVLQAFGRAYEKLPPYPQRLSGDQEWFLAQAVSELATDGKVISVRIALLAEMLKDKEWTLETLKVMGGAAGVGEAFLEDMFGAATAPPLYRVHQRAIRGALRSLLPPDDVLIRGHTKSASELSVASEYDEGSDEFDELLRILDTETRLITPADETDETDETKEQSGADQSQYQLTHDYLVPSLRNWLTRRQQETRRGRAELTLVQRASFWDGRRETRYLPSLWEWLSIRTLTSSANWTPQQRSMMTASARFYLTRIAGVLLILVAFAALARVSFVGRQKAQAKELVEQLVDSDIRRAPPLVTRMQQFQPWTDRELDNRLEEDSLQEDTKLKLALARWPTDERHVKYLLGKMLQGPSAQFTTLRDALSDRSELVTEELWRTVLSTKTDKRQRLMAAAALASYQADDSRWRNISEAIARSMVDESLLNLNVLIDAFQPIRDHLIPHIEGIARRPDSREQEISTVTILKQYFQDDPERYADLLVHATPLQFSELLDYPDNFRPTVDKVSRAILAKPPPAGDVMNPAELSDDLVGELAKAGGQATKDFAYCRSASWDALEKLNSALSDIGYQIHRCRRYSFQDAELFAACWRSGAPGVVERNLTLAQLDARNKEQEESQHVLSDLVSYREGDEQRLVAVWVPNPGDVQQVEYFVGLPRGKVDERLSELEHEFGLRTLQRVDAAADQYTGVWWKQEVDSAFGTDAIDNNDLPGKLVIDTDGMADTPPTDIRQHYEGVLEDEELHTAADRWRRAQAHLALLNYQSAVDDLTKLRDQLPQAAGWTLIGKGTYVEDAHDGQWAVQLTGTSSRVNQTLSVRPHTDYVLTAWMKTSEPEMGADPLTTGASMRVVFTRKLSIATSNRVSADGWQQMTLRFNSGRHRAIVVSLRSINDVPGEWWTQFDSVQLVAASDKSCNLIRCDSFEPNVPQFQRILTRAQIGLGQFDEAKKTIAGVDDCQRPYETQCLLAVISAGQGNVQPAQQTLREVGDNWKNDAQALYTVARSFVNLSKLAKDDQQRTAALNNATKMAVASLKAGYTPASFLTAPLFLPLRDLPQFKEIQKAYGVRRAPVSVWRGASQRDSQRVPAMAGDEHDARARQLREKGYRPVSISVDTSATTQEPVFSSIWHRGLPSAEASIEDAELRANAVVLLFLNSHGDALTSTLATEAVMDRVIHHVATNRFSGESLLALIRKEKGVTRQALVLCLAAVNRTKRDAWQEEAIALMKDLYAKPGHPGVRSAAEWTLRKWGLAGSIGLMDDALMAAKQPHKGPWFVTSEGQTMIAIQGPVQFLMGAPAGESPRPVEARHRRRISRSFAVSSKEVTFRQYKQFLEDASIRVYQRTDIAPDEDCPIVGLTWFEAAAYCRWLSEQEDIPEREMCYPPLDVLRDMAKEGPQAKPFRLPVDHLHRRGYRLPTEAEWEYVYRAGSNSPYFFGSNRKSLDNYGWYGGNSDGRTWPVGLKKPNPLGFFDVIGNAREWSHAPFYSYPKTATGVYVGDYMALSGAQVTIRGGAFVSPHGQNRAAYRMGDRPTSSFYSYGFRVACTIE